MEVKTRSKPLEKDRTASQLRFLIARFFRGWRAQVDDAAKKRIPFDEVLCKRFLDVTDEWLRLAQFVNAISPEARSGHFFSLQMSLYRCWKNGLPFKFHRE